jgi:hypothetical protein
MIKYKNFNKQIENVKEIDSLLKLNSEGNYLGSIDKLIIPGSESEDKIIISGSESEVHLVYNKREFKNEFPLIIDCVKPYFNIINTGYNVVLINNEKYLIYKHNNEMILSEYTNKINYKFDSYKNIKLKNDIKKIIIFNWLMCIANGTYADFEQRVLVKNLNPLINLEECDSVLYLYTFNEKNCSINLDDKSLSIPQTTLNRWFDGSLENFYTETKNLIRGMDADSLKSKLSDIVNYYNNDYISWVNAVFERFRFVKNL